MLRLFIQSLADIANKIDIENERRQFLFQRWRARNRYFTDVMLKRIAHVPEDVQ